MRPFLAIDGVELGQSGPVSVARLDGAALREPDRAAVVGRLLQALVTAGRRWLVVNFAGVRYVDETLLDRLVAVHQRLRAVGGRLVFCGIGPFLAEQLEAAGLHAIIVECADEDDVLDGFDARQAG